MPEKFPIKVGQTVYIVGTGNAGRSLDNRLIECVIDKIGRQYFYVKSNRIFWGRGIAKFSIDDFTCYDSNNNFGYEIYESKGRYLEEVDCREKQKKIKQVFDSYKPLRPETIRTIYDLLVSDGFLA